jgi:2-dehydro-3-deoxy-D-arabinonate dehydratase
MKLCQFHVPGKGRRVGVVDGEQVLDITNTKAGAGSVLELIETGGTAGGVERRARALARRARTRIPWRDLDRAPSPRRAHLLVPVDPPEVWGAGITYRRSREYYEAHGTEAGRTKGIYDYVYEAKRPELFFKATASRTVGPNASIGVRADSVLTAVEPELALVIGRGPSIVGYTIGNDLSAWDIERENPLFLPQSKVFDGCFACGPVIATAGEIRDPHALELSCRIVRAGARRYEGRTNTGEMKRRADELVDWLFRGNAATPPGTVLSTGTGILVPDEHALVEGDVVEISLEGIGVLRNTVRRLPR